MRNMITFPIRVGVRMDGTWPIEAHGRKFFIELKDGVTDAVSVIYEKLPISDAPRVINPGSPIKPPEIKFSNSRINEAERDVRSWQALISSFAHLEIDYFSYKDSYFPESGEQDIDVASFTRSPGKLSAVEHDFATFGRAFLAIADGYSLIEPMSFYREGTSARNAGKYIEAYNYFYLFIETMFNVPSKTRQATELLLKTATFLDAIDETLNEPYFDSMRKDLSFKGITSWKHDKSPLVKEIVELRGHLRHHSMANAKRWDPNEQDRYAPEAAFLGAVCQDISRPMTFDRTWETGYLQEFARQSRELGFMAEVSVAITMKDADGIVRDVGFQLDFPSADPTPKLAQAALTKAMEVFSERSPGAALYAIRARIKPRGPELFRYDLGPGIGR